MYRLSIQWGSGMHYFDGGIYSDLSAARYAANRILANLQRQRGKRTPTATIRMWKLEAEVATVKVVPLAVPVEPIKEATRG